MKPQVATFASNKFAQLDLDGIDVAALFADPTSFGYEAIGGSRPNVVEYTAYKRMSGQFAWQLHYLVRVHRPSPLLAFADSEADLAELIMRVRPQPVLPTNPGNYRV